jgi:hypothetical protein
VKITGEPVCERQARVFLGGALRCLACSKPLPKKMDPEHIASDVRHDSMGIIQRQIHERRPVVHCLLYIVYCLLSIVYCLLSIVCCLLSVVCCLLSVVYCLLPVVYCLLSVVCCLLYIACCVLSVVCCMLSVVHCLLSIVCCVLSVVCCLLFFSFREHIASDVWQWARPSLRWCSSRRSRCSCTRT